MRFFHAPSASAMLHALIHRRAVPAACPYHQCSSVVLRSLTPTESFPADGHLYGGCARIRLGSPGCECAAGNVRALSLRPLPLLGALSYQGTPRMCAPSWSLRARACTVLQHLQRKLCEARFPSALSCSEPRLTAPPSRHHRHCRPRSNSSAQQLFPASPTPPLPTVVRGGFVIGFVITGTRSNGVTSGAGIATALQGASTFLLGNLMQQRVRRQRLCRLPDMLSSLEPRRLRLDSTTMRHCCTAHSCCPSALSACSCSFFSPSRPLLPGHRGHSHFGGPPRPRLHHHRGWCMEHHTAEHHGVDLAHHIPAGSERMAVIRRQLSSRKRLPCARPQNIHHPPSFARDTPAPSHHVSRIRLLMLAHACPSFYRRRKPPSEHHRCGPCVSGGEVGGRAAAAPAAAACAAPSLRKHLRSAQRARGPANAGCAPKRTHSHPLTPLRHRAAHSIALS